MSFIAIRTVTRRAGFGSARDPDLEPTGESWAHKFSLFLSLTSLPRSCSSCPILSPRPRYKKKGIIRNKRMLLDLDLALLHHHVDMTRGVHFCLPAPLCRLESRLAGHVGGNCFIFAFFRGAGAGAVIHFWENRRIQEQGKEDAALPRCM